MALPVVRPHYQAFIDKLAESKGWSRQEKHENQLRLVNHAREWLRREFLVDRNREFTAQIMDWEWTKRLFNAIEVLGGIDNAFPMGKTEWPKPPCLEPMQDLLGRLVPTSKQHASVVRRPQIVESYSGCKVHDGIYYIPALLATCMSTAKTLEDHEACDRCKGESAGKRYKGCIVLPGWMSDTCVNCVHASDHSECNISKKYKP